MKKIIAWILLIPCFSLGFTLMCLGFFDTFNEFMVSFLVISLTGYVCFGLIALTNWCVDQITQ